MIISSPGEMTVSMGAVFPLMLMTAISRGGAPMMETRFAKLADSGASPIQIPGDPAVEKRRKVP
jgi:hypothetical protein